MAYKYRNVKTGEIIITTNRVGGKRWEPVKEKPAENKEQASVKQEAPKSAKKGKQ